MEITFNPSSRMHQPGWLSGIIHVVILGVAIQAESAEVWPFALLAMSGVSFFAWIANYRRYRYIHDLPTSRVASAAQGYVELTGRGQPFGDIPLLGRLTQLPCLWYRYKIEQRTSRNKWQTVDSGESDDTFMLRDDTGVCVVDGERGAPGAGERPFTCPATRPAG